MKGKEALSWHFSLVRFTFVFLFFFLPYAGFPGGSDGKESACNAGDQVQSLGREDTLEKEMPTHSSILAWRIPWTEESGGFSA